MTISLNRWQHIEVPASEDELNQIASDLDLNPVLVKFLLYKKIDISNKEKVHEFISPKKSIINDFENISSPDQLAKALECVKKAIENKDKIIINGDPDADGITGTTILTAGLNFLGAKVQYDFPTRAKEGHGLQARIIDYANENNIPLIITTDCGTKDVEAVSYANSMNIKVIIIDHHILGHQLPEAYAFINPYLKKDAFGEQKLSGSLLTYKFLIAVAHYLKKTLSDELKDYLLAIGSLGALSDRVTLREPLNRIMIKEGIRALNETQMQGLKALKRSSSVGDSWIKPRETSKAIVPKLNAPGRIGDKEEGIPDSNAVVDLLLLGTGKQNEEKAFKILDLLKSSLNSHKQEQRSFEELESKLMTINNITEKRRKITSKIEDEIQVLIDALAYQDKKVIVIKGHNWNPGVIGIDADRIKERYLKPVIIFTTKSDNEYVRASVRSIPTVNMYEVLNKISDDYESKNQEKLFCVEVKTKHGHTIVNSFGGHPQACGFTVHQKNYDFLVNKIHEEVDNLPEDDLQYSYHILDTLHFDDLKPSYVKMLEKLSPYGQDFDLPVFMLKNCKFAQHFRAFGSKYQKTQTPHIEFRILHPGSSDEKHARKLKAIGYGLWHKFKELVLTEKNANFDIIFTIETYKGTRRKNNKGRRERVEANVLDIRKSN